MKNGADREPWNGENAPFWNVLYLYIRGSFFLSCLCYSVTIDYRERYSTSPKFLQTVFSPSHVQWDVLSPFQSTIRGTIGICSKYLVHTPPLWRDGEGRERGTAVSPTHNTPLCTQEHKRSAYLCLTSWR